MYDAGSRMARRLALVIAPAFVNAFDVSRAAAQETRTVTTSREDIRARLGLDDAPTSVGRISRR